MPERTSINHPFTRFTYLVLSLFLLLFVVDTGGKDTEELWRDMASRSRSPTSCLRCPLKVCRRRHHARPKEAEDDHPSRASARHIDRERVLPHVVPVRCLRGGALLRMVLATVVGISVRAAEAYDFAEPRGA